MKLRDCEGQLQAAMRECDEMRMAIREKKGPWFDEVRANVEARVRDVMAHSRELESQIEQHRQLHRERLQDFSAERSRLAGEIKALRDGLADAEAKIAQAEEGAGRAQDRLQSALSETEVRAQQMNDLQAENRVLADSMRSMREECSEIWMKEQRMVAQMKSLDAALSSSRKSEEHLTSQLDTARSQLATQVSMNRDLMHRKEAVEWELMETQAQAKDCFSVESKIDAQHVSAQAHERSTCQPTLGRTMMHTSWLLRSCDRAVAPAPWQRPSQPTKQLAQTQHSAHVRKPLPTPRPFQLRHGRSP
ncbi:unnamed protein product [Ostreobium quekettii]|uniref:Uncharacterized protein n=1 Tax=Ostreobium quekettii TaxID=121088 RepID=A0A8S1ITL1_9CHLO|nr:unnamed protein product [Ostreobium quekettii]